MRHRERHPAELGAVPDCGPCRWRGVHVSPAATPTRSGVAGRQYAFQQDFAAEFVNGDREAYKRLREQGLQPPTIRGSAKLEAHAETRYEVETGQVATDRKALANTLEFLSDGGVDPLLPAITPKGD